MMRLIYFFLALTSTITQALATSTATTSLAAFLLVSLPRFGVHISWHANRLSLLIIPMQYIIWLEVSLCADKSWSRIDYAEI